MIVPLFTTVKKQGLGLPAPVSMHQRTTLRFANRLSLPGPPPQEEENQETQTVPQALFKQQMETLFLCKNKLAEERKAKEELETTILAQDAHHTELETKIAHTQHDLEATRSQLSLESAKRRTLEFAHSALTSKYTSLLAAHTALSSSHTAALQDATADLAATALARDRAAHEIRETRHALDSLRNVHSAATSASAVLSAQVATLHVSLNAMRAERDGLARALREAQQDAEGARAAAEAAESRLCEEKRRVQVLEERLKESEGMRMDAERRAADADWTARDEFAKPPKGGIAVNINVLDVDLFEAQMERDLYRAQYEEEEVAREEAEKELGAVKAELRIAQDEIVRLKEEKEVQEALLEAEREQSNECIQESRANATTANIRTHAPGIQRVDVSEKKSEAKTASMQPHSEDAKENEAPHRRPPIHTNIDIDMAQQCAHSHRFEGIFRDEHVPSPSFGSEIMFHSSPVLETSHSICADSCSLGTQELQELLSSDIFTHPRAVDALDDYPASPLMSPVPLARAAPAPAFTLHDPKVFEELIAQENARFRLSA